MIAAPTVPAPAAADASCSPAATVGPMLPAAYAEDLAVLLKALSDPTRLQLLAMIENSAAGEACVCDLAQPFDMSQPAISHHLKILVTAGVLNREKRGAWAWYSINPSRLEPLRHLLPGPAFLQGAAGADA